MKSHAAPLKIDAISELFQDFYLQAESHIAIHIAALTTKMSRDNASASSAIARRTVSKRVSQDSLIDQQMLTPAEIAEKRKARRRLELQRTSLEEAVERSVCDKVYDKIYRHRSTDDEEKDAKLRSKTAALSLVGVGLKELNVNIPEQKDGDDAEIKDRISQQLAAARDHLQRMDEARYPLGKLQRLTAAHQSIVETLAKIFPSTSSADEVLPTLIYTLVTSAPESLNIASNLHFMQRFRARAKIDGEAAYCLVNLEAAISFLETVDLSSLQADSPSQLATLTAKKGEDHPTEVMSLTADLPSVSRPRQNIDDGEPTAALQSPRHTTASQQGMITQMLQSQAGRIEAGKETLLLSADNALDSINSTLDSSFKFLFGRLREQGAGGQRPEVIIPKTLDDARRLVNSPTSEPNQVQDSASKTNVTGILTHEAMSQSANKMLGLVAGRRASRDASADSIRSGSSITRTVPFGSIPEQRSAISGPAEAVGNLVNAALNPLSRFNVGVPSFARFSRSPSGPLPLASSTEPSPILVTSTFEPRKGSNPAEDARLIIDGSERIAQVKGSQPPLEKFVKMGSSKNLRLGDVEELLRDYQRLAALVSDQISK